MPGKVISIRLNTDKLTDKKADNILSNLPSRRKSEYIRNAIIAYNDQENLIELIKQAMTKTLEEWDVKQAEKKKESNESENGYEDFLKSL